MRNNCCAFERPFKIQKDSGILVAYCSSEIFGGSDPIHPRKPLGLFEFHGLTYKLHFSPKKLRCFKCVL